MMRRMILNRLGTSVLSLFLLVTIVFFLIHATPGGPAYSILGMHATPEAVAALNKQMGLDHPLWQQYGIWWTHLFEGNLGYSFTQHAPVASLMGSYLANSIILYVLATVIAVLFFGTHRHVPRILGRTYSRRSHRRRADHCVLHPYFFHWSHADPVFCHLCQLVSAWWNWR